MWPQGPSVVTAAVALVVGACSTCMQLWNRLW